MRLRLGSGLTFEPTFRFGTSTVKRDDGVIKSDDQTSVMGLGTLVRVPVLRHHKADFEVLVVSYTTTSTQQVGGAPATGSNLAYGFAFDPGVQAMIHLFN